MQHIVGEGDRMRHASWLRYTVPASLALASCSAAPSGPAVPAGASSAESFAAVAPKEVRAIMIELDLAQALDRCGFPAIGTFIRDQLGKKIETCPNSDERKAALRLTVESAKRREGRREDEARAQDADLTCAEPDGLKLIKETIPVAQRVVAAAEQPLACDGISEARR
jgi:hypothetical protein